MSMVFSEGVGLLFFFWGLLCMLQGGGVATLAKQIRKMPEYLNYKKKSFFIARKTNSLNG